jgi:cell wall-associated NlpC family hydrolase
LFVLALVSCDNSPNQVQVTNIQADKALNNAIQPIGKPYIFGGRGPDTFDCSGLITWSYKNAVGRDNIFAISSQTTDDVSMAGLYNWNVQLIPYEKMAPGDIIFITNAGEKVTHGGLFIRWVDNNTFKFVNVSSYYGEVAKDTWAIGEIKREQWLVGAGRLKIVY